LLLFAMFHAKDAQIQSKKHRAVCSTSTFGTVLPA
jgi:hypothetical protein